MWLLIAGWELGCAFLSQGGDGGVSIVCLTCLSCSLFQTNEKGQVVTKTALLKQMEELIEEPGLTCCICREGYKFQVRGRIAQPKFEVKFSAMSSVSCDRSG